MQIHENKHQRFIGEFNDKKVYVYDKEGYNVPHFHIEIGKAEISIALYNASYYFHKEKEGYTYEKIISYTLSNEELKELIQWLDQPSDLLSKITNWETIEIAWKLSNGNKYIFATSKPDYSKLLNQVE